MQEGKLIDDLGFCPSFSCYSSSSSTAAVRVSSQLQQEHTARFHGVDEEEFDFSFVIGDEDIIASDGRTDFPLFHRGLLIDQNEADRVGKMEVEETVCTASFEKLFINEPEESDSSLSDGESPRVFCVWRYKTDAGSSPFNKCKKNSSTGSGSKRWRIRDLLRRSNSEGKEPMALLSHKKIEIPKQKSGSGEVSGKSKASSPSIHELLYVRQRAKGEDGKRKSYLPYRRGLMGFFTDVNGSGKKL